MVYYYSRSQVRCDVGLEEGDIEKTVSVLQYCVLL